MFLSVLHFFNVLIFLDLTLAILTCILLIKVPMRYAIKFALVPIIIFSTFVLLVEGEKLLGRPYDMIPVGKFEFIEYRVIVKDGIKKIELWVIQDKESRLHLIPYSEQTEQEMAKAKTRRDRGMRERGEFTDKDGDGIDDLSIADIPMEEIVTPKEDEPVNNGPEELTPEELRNRRNLTL